ncbi:SpoIIE family protein phosphatase [Actinophytocola sp.]|uniref:SpoIIE family protein phosphatase n=1 Tax=Actinophytocola sp. TaxID=1872138 RepID=UPI003899ACFB
MGEDLPADLAEAVALGGEMGRRFGEYDWASHPLGPLSGWSPAMRATVAVALTSRFPIVLWLDPRQLYLVYNDAYVPMLGERHPAALGTPGRQVWWDIWDSIGGMLDGVVATGKATWSADLLLPLVTADNPQERYFTFSYSPIVMADGHVGGIFCAVTETTERVLGERRLHILNTLASTLVETQSVDDAVRAVLDLGAKPLPDLPFVALYVREERAGSARLRAATPRVADLLPATLDDLAALPADVGQRGAVVDDLLERLPGLASVFVHSPRQALVLPTAGGVGKDEVVGALVVALNPLRPLDDQYRGFCSLLRDQVSAAFAAAGSYERERRRGDALAELDRAKTAFLTNVSHEFRTPLTLLLGPVEDAIAQAGGDEDQVARLRTVQRNAGRLLRLVNSLLDFSRTEAGRAQAERVRVDLGALTEQIVSSFSELCDRAGLDLVLRCASVDAEVDVRMWETIVLNLLSNAVKFTFAGSITVEVAPDGERVRVSVADTGIGISEGDLPHLFDRFYRAGNNRGRTVEGSGIGLALVRSLVELQAGGIEVASEVDRGTTVTITLPAATAESALAGHQVWTAPVTNPYVAEASQWLDAPESEPAHEPGGRDLVFVVDDNADMRQHLRRVLSGRWEVVTYADGEAALEGVRRHRPALVITDVMMPKLDGFGFVGALRADPDLASTPVLMLSARAGLESAGEGFAHGADDYLPKPFTSADLLARVTARVNAVARERAARARDDEDSRHVARVAEFQVAMGSVTSIAEALTTLIAFPVAGQEATAAALGVREDSRIRITYEGQMLPELQDRYHVVGAESPIPLADVIRTGTPIVITDIADADPRYQWTLSDSEDSVRALVIHPIRDALGEVIAAAALLWSHPRSFAPADLEAIRVAMLTTATTVNRALAAEREHRIAVGFQEQLLRLDRGSTAAVIAAVYEPAAEAMRVGGDWYQATPVPDSTKLCVSVGDVVGHGLPAATVMSTLRAATAAATVTDTDPAAVLSVLQRCAAAEPGAHCATVAYAVLDAATHTLGYACAGHPYPLVVLPDGTSRYLKDGRQMPLAASSGNALTGPPGHIELPPASLVLLYTDGLIERRGESLDAGFARLAEAAEACATLPAGAVCDELLRRMAPARGYTDDVAILAIRTTGATPDRFVACVPADIHQVPVVRQRMRPWLRDMDLPDDLVYDVLLSTCEALANAIEHGSGSARATTVSVEGAALDDSLSVTVSDSGQWTADSSASRHIALRGRGLTLMNGLADHVDTVRTARGTRVTMTYRRSAAQEAPHGATP